MRQSIFCLNISKIANTVDAYVGEKTIKRYSLPSYILVGDQLQAGIQPLK